MKNQQQANDWTTKYFSWLKEKTLVRDINGWTEIATPFLDRHNDGITIYVKRNKDKIIISDDGYTLRDLEACGLSFTSSARNQILQNFIKGFGINIFDKELIIEANDTNFPQKKHFLIQAILAINDMFILSRNHVANIFLEDLAAYFDDNDVRYTSDIQVQGLSGLSYRIDFVIAKSKKRPERIISAINSPNLQSAKITLFNWNDIQQTRKPDSLLYVFINDNRKVQKNVLDTLNAYKTTPILWSKRDNFLSDLVS